MFSIHLDVFTTLILAIMLFILGNFLKSRLSILSKFCIPSPVVGGLLFSILTFILRMLNIGIITMDTVLMDYFIALFFSIVGISLSLSLAKQGGKLLIKYWILGGVLAYLQNFLTLILADVTGIHPLLALMCGSISMEGGHGYAAAFGSSIESLGVSDAISVGITASTFGLILAGLIGGPVGKFLIERYNLKSTASPGYFDKNLAMMTKSSFSRSSNISIFSVLEQILVVFLCVALGKFLSYIIFNLTGTIVPSITGCIFVSVLFRNINDYTHFIKLDFSLLDFLSEIFLGIFLTMALMSIDLFKLSGLFGPIVIIVISQAIFIVLFSVFIVFRVLGKNLDSAIMVSGLIGHGLGATPVALANMSSLCGKYGYSPKAFLIVPLVAAFLLDVFTMPSIILFINLLS